VRRPSEYPRYPAIKHGGNDRNFAATSRSRSRGSRDGSFPKAQAIKAYEPNFEVSRVRQIILGDDLSPVWVSTHRLRQFYPQFRSHTFERGAVSAFIVNKSVLGALDQDWLEGPVVGDRAVFRSRLRLSPGKGLLWAGHYPAVSEKLAGISFMESVRCIAVKLADEVGRVIVIKGNMRHFLPWRGPVFACWYGTIRPEFRRSPP